MNIPKHDRLTCKTESKENKLKTSLIKNKNLLQNGMFYNYLLFDLKPSAVSPEFWDESVRLNFISSFRGENELL